MCIAKSQLLFGLKHWGIVDCCLSVFQAVCIFFKTVLDLNPKSVLIIPSYQYTS